MNNKKRIIIDVFAILLGIVFLVFGIKDAINYYNKSVVPDNIKLKKDFQNLNKNNYFKYITISEIKKNEKNILLLYGSKYDPWTHVLMPILDKISQEQKINIYYLEKDNSINSDLEKGYVTPTLVFLKKNKVMKIIKQDEIYNYDYNVVPIDYWNENKIVKFKELIIHYIDIYNIENTKK